MDDRVCSVDGCLKLAVTRGLCQDDYQRAYIKGELDKHPKIQGTRKCSIDECGKKYASSGYCWQHYMTNRRNGDPLIEIRRRKGTGHLDGDGYMIVSEKNHPNSNSQGSISEHRLVMSNHLGRALLDHENVHHKNGVRHDNRISNLEVWSVKQPPWTASPG